MIQADGYVTEIAYTHGFHAQMAPGPIALALGLRGIAAPDFSRPFTWCELGFGQGVNLAVLAACFPHGRFFGNDILPAHVDHARGLSHAAGLDNLTVTTDGFDAFADHALPPMDVIALHGVWSWVGRGNRARIVDFIRRHLKPGGIVYVSYNALPGWSHHLPLRHLMKAHLDQMPAEVPLADRIRAAVAFAGRVAGTGGGYFAATPSTAARLADLAERPVGYLAHEYFNRAWDPQHFSEAAGELAGAGLAFAAPALAGDHLDRSAMTPEARALLDAQDSPLLRETVRDFLTNQPFRRDLFVRTEWDGLVLPMDGKPSPAVLRLPFTALGHARAVPGEAALPQGGFRLDRDLCVAFIERLAGGPAGAATLAGAQGVDAARVLETLVILSALGLAAPACGGADPVASGVAADRTARLNARILALAETGDTVSALASPVLGSGVEADRIERLFLQAVARGAEPAGFAWDVLARRGERLLRDGRLLTAERDNREELADRLRRFTRDRLPVLRGLGVA